MEQTKQSANQQQNEKPHARLCFSHTKRSMKEGHEFRLSTNLNIIVRIPVGVINEHCVSCSQINTQASRPSRQQETECLSTRS